MCLALIFATEVLLFNSRWIILKSGYARFPWKEKDSLFAIWSYLLRIAWIEFDPVLILELLSVFKLKADYGALLFLVSPVPKRYGLWLIVAKCNEIVIVCRNIDSLHTVRVRIEIGSDWCAWDWVPYNKHGVITAICCDNPAFIFWACCSGNTIAMTLKKTLCLGRVVIEDTSVCWRVEDFLNILMLKSCMIKSRSGKRWLTCLSWVVRLCTPWSMSLLNPMTYWRF